jgi:uncharacterized repeat protein (TIGR03803 family)
MNCDSTPCTSPDGFSPAAGLIYGPDHQLFGTTEQGGPSGLGTVFATPAIVNSSPDPTPVANYSFGSQPSDGSHPYFGRLVTSGDGVFFGTTADGGANGRGTVFMATFRKNTWTEQTIYSFGAYQGDVVSPQNGVVLGKDGAVYGCAGGGIHKSGGVYQGGVYKLTPPAAGATQWSETIPYYFGAQAMDPSANPYCGIAMDGSGNIFGTTSGGGKYGEGAFFELTPPPAGQQYGSETVLHSFGKVTKGVADGTAPQTGPVEKGTVFYGVTPSGGAGGFGIAYKINVKN